MLWASVGAFQVIASWADLKGLSFFRHKAAGYAFGISTITAAFIWFFVTDKHISPHETAQLGDQFVFSVAGVVFAILLTAIVSSVVKLRTFQHRPNSIENGKGIETFRNKTVFQVIRDELQRGTEEK